ncbi:MAG: aminoglycoside phosphotransferase family protein [Anaerolineae bacterium]
MPEPLVSDVHYAEAFLARRFGDVGDVVYLAAGDWSSAYALRAAGRDYVVRFGAHREDFAKDRLAARWACPALPIPRVVELGRAFGGYYAISERVFGRYIDDVDETQMRDLLPSLFAALDAARLTDLSATTGYGALSEDGHASYATWEACLLDVANDRPTDRTRGWRERLASSSVGDEPFDEAYTRLQALAGRLPVARHLIHSDLLHYNVLVEGDRITGVLDWGCALYGDFLYDLAWFCFWQPWFPAWQPIDFRAEALRHYTAIGLDVPCFEERLRCCQIHIGLAGQAYMAYADDWENLPRAAQRTLNIACERSV